ncbi:radical SAM protein [Dolichospermum circinale CS-537/01]|uniref:Radical SAM protein n=1 Tax=Dolichospermum circinale CS-537/01 TaxID=3021739 RepID=A0ABT5A4U0_9CYAN|nr:radical SAM protein [Dolichospermum circinale]MDB9486950.1 radical SAM protein [Dolichospermum circinale CS-537/01]
MLTTNYHKSQYCHIVNGENDRFFIYHSLFNKPREVTSSIVEFLNFFEKPKTLEDANKVFGNDIYEVFKSLEKLYLLIPNNFNEISVIESLQKDFLKELEKGTQISRLELAISNACNFGCQHCMHFLNNEVPSRISPELNMSAEIAKASIDKFVEKVRASGNNFVRVHFGNGEPLINWKVLLFCLEYCESINDIKFSYAINTNLSLLTKDRAKILKKYNVKISTSLDGVGKVNDLIRVDCQGQGTFDKIISKINLLQSIDYPIDGFSVTVTDANYDFINEDVIDFAKSIGVKDVSMDFDLVRSIHTSVEDCVNKIITLRRYAHQKGLNFYGTWETPYRILMSNSWLSTPHFRWRQRG